MPSPQVLDPQSNQRDSGANPPSPDSGRNVSSIVLAVLLLGASVLALTLPALSVPFLGLLMLAAMAALAAFFTGKQRPGAAAWLKVLSGAFTLAAGVFGPLSAEAAFSKGLLPRIHFMGLDAMAVPLVGSVAALCAGLLLGAPSLVTTGRKSAKILATVGLVIFAVLWILPQPTSRFTPVDSRQAAVDDLVLMDAEGQRIQPTVFRSAEGAASPIIGWTAYKNNALATALLPVNPGPVQYMSSGSDEYHKALHRIQASRIVGSLLHPIAFWTWLMVLLVGIGLVTTLWVRKETLARYLAMGAALLAAYVPLVNLGLAAKNFPSGLFDSPLTSTLAPALLDMALLAALVVLITRPVRSS